MTPRSLLSLSAVFALSACSVIRGGSAAPSPAGTSVTENGITWISPYGPATRPFTPAVRDGDLLFLSGQIGTEASARGELIAGGVKPETRQTMLNIKDVLEKSGSSMERVVKCTVFMADMREWGDMNEVYVTFFPTNKPARSALGANGLALGAKVEIECIAKVGDAPAP